MIVGVEPMYLMLKIYDERYKKRDVAHFERLKGVSVQYTIAWTRRPSRINRNVGNYTQSDTVPLSLRLGINFEMVRSTSLNQRAEAFGLRCT